MLTLKTVGRTFEVPLRVVEGGTGTIYGVLSEAPQDTIPSYIFVPSRRVLRVTWPTALKFGQVVEAAAGTRFILGSNGSSEQPEGVLWQGFRLFEVTQKVRWTRRGKVIDPITRLEKEGVDIDMGLISVAIEPTDREDAERRIHTSVEKARFIAGADIQPDDMLGNYKVVRSDLQLGLKIGMLSY